MSMSATLRKSFICYTKAVKNLDRSRHTHNLVRDVSFSNTYLPGRHSTRHQNQTTSPPNRVAVESTEFHSLCSSQASMQHGCLRTCLTSGSAVAVSLCFYYLFPWDLVFFTQYGVSSLLLYDGTNTRNII
jgi:hypothetical protein